MNHRINLWEKINISNTFNTHSTIVKLISFRLLRILCIFISWLRRLIWLSYSVWVWSLWLLRFIYIVIIWSLLSIWIETWDEVWWWVWIEILISPSWRSWVWIESLALACWMIISIWAIRSIKISFIFQFLSHSSL